MSSEENNRRLQGILQSYLEAVDRGERPDRQRLLDDNPDLREELEKYLADASRLDQLARSLQTLGYDDDGNGSAETGDRVRYFGDYQLLEEIARGGMGVVYKAQQVSLQRVVAVKMILKGEMASSADVERFQHEARAAANLDHPNIVPIYEVGEHEGQQYFSMKLIESTPFSGDPQGSVATLSKVARAVHHAHQRGILHRDLKPSNILIDQNGEPHVADFGLAKQMASPGRESGEGATKSGAIVGTPAYMAPEQARAEKSLTTAVDVYSLGAILYEWLTGQPPFRGGDPLSTLLKVIDEEPVKPRSLNASIPRDLETICLKCLEKNPARRYGSAQELADDLERWLHGEPIHARSVSWSERASKWVRRRPALAALLLVLLLGVPAAIAAVTWQWREAVLQEAKARSELARAETALYVNRIGRAYADWRDNELARGWVNLIVCPESQRGWEWTYLHELCDNQQETPIAKNDEPCRIEVAFSPNAELIAAATTDPLFAQGQGPFQGELRIVKLPHMGISKALPNSTGWAVCSVAFSPDSKLLAVGGRLPGVTPDGFNGQGHVKVWDVQAGKELYTLAEHARGGPVEAVAFSPDGRYLATGSGYRIVISEAGTGEQVRILDGAARSLAFRPDGKEIVAAIGQTVKVWDVGSGRSRLTLQPDLRGTWEFLRAAFSADGQRLVTLGSSGPGDVRFWDAASGAPLGNVRGLNEHARAIALSPDGRRVAIGCANGTIALHDVDTGVPLFTLRGHRGPVTSVAFSADGTQLVSGGNDKSIRLWIATRSHEVLILRNELADVATLALSADGNRVAGLIGTTLRSWNSETGEQILQVFDAGESRGRHSLAFTPDARHVVLAGVKRLRLWELATGKEDSIETKATTQCLVFSPDGTNLVTVDEQGQAALWDWKARRILRTLPHIERSPPAFSKDGKRLAFVAEAADPRVVVINVDNGAELASVATDSPFVSALALSADGTRLLGVDAGQRKLQVWDIASGRRILDRLLPGQYISNAAFSPDGKRLAFAHRSDEMEIWDTTAGEQVLVLKIPPHTTPGIIGNVVWNNEGTHLAAGSSGGTVWVWAAAANNPASLDDYFASWQRKAAQDAERERHWFAAVFHLDAALKRDPASSSLRRRRGEAYANLGNWQRAADDLGAAITAGETSFDTHYQCLLTQAATKNAAAAETMARLMQQWGDTSDPHRARRLLQAWSLVPIASTERARILALFEVSLARHPLVVATVGSDLAKTYPEALRLLQDEKLARRPNKRLSWPFLPLLCESLGDKVQAEAWRSQLVEQCRTDRERRLQELQGRIGLAAGEKVGWEDVLALDLLKAALERLTGKMK